MRLNVILDTLYFNLRVHGRFLGNLTNSDADCPSSSSTVGGRKSLLGPCQGRAASMAPYGVLRGPRGPRCRRPGVCGVHERPPPSVRGLSRLLASDYAILGFFAWEVIPVTRVSHPPCPACIANVRTVELTPPNPLIWVNLYELMSTYLRGAIIAEEIPDA